MAREINLVPDVKGEMIKALKLRNFILFLSIVVASASLAAILVFASIAGGQQAIVDGKKATVNELSAKLNSYTELSDFLTIKDQLGNLSTINDNKRLLSRTFGILSALLPTNGDTITLSELNINLEEENPTIAFEAQANANNEPFIDYNVLDSFKKSMQYMHYDYGSYVDKNGETIPAYCMIESGADGASFYDSTRGRYAYWLIEGEGCNPSSEGEDALSVKDYATEDYEDNTVVRIWRTPQYDDWYKEEQVEGRPYMGLDGTISGVEHFASECITYTGALDGKKPIWSESNDNCLLVPDGVDGIVVSDTSNARMSSGDLVLRFNARITLSPDIYDFNKKHAIAIAPTGRHNVTDSYVQIQHMFEKRADDCDENDVACKTENNGGNN